MSSEAKPVVEFEANPWDLDLGEVKFEEGPPSEPEPEKPKYEELQAKLSALEAEHSKTVEQANEVLALKEAISGLRPEPQAAPEPEKPKQQSPEEFNAWLKEQLYGDNPLEALKKAVGYVAGGDFQTVAEMARTALRETTRSDKNLGEYFSRYEGEVESEVAKRPDRYSNPNVYKEVTEVVASRHIKDIIAEEVDKRLNEQKKAAPPVSYSEVGGSQPPAARQPKVYRVTAEDERERKLIGMSREDWYKTKYGG